MHDSIDVGKTPTKHRRSQDEINQILVEEAKAGHMVVRLKGGDSFVFGRGSEEAIVLHEAGIPFEVVPGVTSAIAVPAYAAIPVTHRGISTEFAVITGHEDPNKPESTIDWAHLAKGVGTCVFLMGVKNLEKIVGPSLGTWPLSRYAGRHHLSRLFLGTASTRSSIEGHTPPSRNFLFQATFDYRYWKCRGVTQGAGTLV